MCLSRDFFLNQNCLKCRTHDAVMERAGETGTWQQGENNNVEKWFHCSMLGMERITVLIL